MKPKISQDLINKLKAPLPAEAIHPHPTKTYLSTIKAIYVIERFNEVFGIGGWYINNEVIKQEGKMVVVKSTFICEEYGIQIPDIFGGNDNPDLGDAYKGACTDALTKIGSYLYVGMDVYKGKGDKTPVIASNGEKGHTTPATSKAPEDATWMTEAEFNKILKEMNDGKYDNYKWCLTNRKMKRTYREELEKSYKFCTALDKQPTT